MTGIISMENILESIIGIPIMDEKDAKMQRILQQRGTGGRRGSIRVGRAFQRQSSTINAAEVDDYFPAAEDAREGESPAVYRTDALQGFFEQMRGEVSDRVRRDVVRRSLHASSDVALSAGTFQGRMKRRVGKPNGEVAE